MPKKTDEINVAFSQKDSKGTRLITIEIQVEARELGAAETFERQGLITSLEARLRKIIKKEVSDYIQEPNALMNRIKKEAPHLLKVGDTDTENGNELGEGDGENSGESSGENKSTKKSKNTPSGTPAEP